MTDAITLVEVGPRDGLQNIDTWIPTTTKSAMIQTLLDAGLKRIEVTAFVAPHKIPQMRDAEALCQTLPWASDVSFECLVPNIEGYKRASAFDFHCYAFFTSASRTFCQANIDCAPDESLERYRLLQAASGRTTARVYLSCTWDCPYEGRVRQASTLKMMHQLFKLGAVECVLSDTLGTATPKRTKQLLQAVGSEFGLSSIAVHFHDTHDLAIANITEALDMGVRIVDCAAGGLGGCPYAPGAKGNVATEKVLALLARHGVKTNIDANKVRQAAALIHRHLDAH